MQGAQNPLRQASLLGQLERPLQLTPPLEEEVAPLLVELEVEVVVVVEPVELELLGPAPVLELLGPAPVLELEGEPELLAAVVVEEDRDEVPLLALEPVEVADEEDPPVVPELEAEWDDDVVEPELELCDVAVMPFPHATRPHAASTAPHLVNRAMDSSQSRF